MMSSTSRQMPMAAGEVNDSARVDLRQRLNERQAAERQLSERRSDNSILTAVTPPIQMPRRRRSEGVRDEDYDRIMTEDPELAEIIAQYKTLILKKTNKDSDSDSDSACEVEKSTATNVIVDEREPQTKPEMNGQLADVRLESDYACVVEKSTTTIVTVDERGPEVNGQLPELGRNSARKKKGPNDKGENSNARKIEHCDYLSAHEYESSSGPSESEMGDNDTIRMKSLEQRSEENLFVKRLVEPNTPSQCHFLEVRGPCISRKAEKKRMAEPSHDFDADDETIRNKASKKLKTGVPAYAKNVQTRCIEILADNITKNTCSASLSGEMVPKSPVDGTPLIDEDCFLEQRNQSSVRNLEIQSSASLVLANVDVRKPVSGNLLSNFKLLSKASRQDTQVTPSTRQCAALNSTNLPPVFSKFGCTSVKHASIYGSASYMPIAKDGASTKVMHKFVSPLMANLNYGLVQPPVASTVAGQVNGSLLRQDELLCKPRENAHYRQVQDCSTAIPSMAYDPQPALAPGQITPFNPLLHENLIGWNPNLPPGADCYSVLTAESSVSNICLGSRYLRREEVMDWSYYTTDYIKQFYPKFKDDRVYRNNSA